MESVGEWVIVEVVEESSEVTCPISALSAAPIAKKARLVSSHAPVPGNSGVRLELGDLVLVVLVGGHATIHMEDGRILYAVNQYNIVAKL